MYFSTFLSRNIFRRKVRTLLTTAGIAISIMAVIALVGVSDSYVASTQSQYALHSIDMVVVRAGVADRLNSSLSEHFAETLAKLPDVEAVNPVLTNRVSLGRDTPGGVLAQGLPPWSRLLASLTFTDGKAFDDTSSSTSEDKEGGSGEEPKEGSILLGQQLAENIKKKVGDVVMVEESPYRVVGIFHSSNPFENNTAIFPLHELQRLMERGQQVSEFQLTVSSEARGDEQRLRQLRSAIEELRDEDGRKLGLAAMPTSDYVASNTQLRIAKAMSWVTSAIALFIGFVGVVNTMFTSVMERTQEIGVLRAIGWKKRRIMSMILGESLLLSIVGAAVGTVLAIFLVRALSRFEAAQAFVIGAVPLHVVAIGFLLAVFVGILGGLYPAIRATQLQPTEALRHE